MESFCIGLVAGYELTSFASRGRLPTVTSLVMRLPHPARAVVVGLLWVWTVDHFQLRPR